MINELSVSVSNYSCTADDVCNFFFVSKSFYLRDDVSSCNDIAEAVCIIIEKNQMKYWVYCPEYGNFYLDYPHYYVHRTPIYFIDLNNNLNWSHYFYISFSKGIYLTFRLTLAYQVNKKVSIFVLAKNQIFLPIVFDSSSRRVR